MTQAAAQPYTGGDDLDDGLDVAPEYMPTGAIDGDDVDIRHSDAGEDAQGFFSEDEGDNGSDQDDERDEDDSAEVGQKRKATTGESERAQVSGAPLSDQEKKKKRKLKAKERSEKVGKNDISSPHVFRTIRRRILTAIPFSCIHSAKSERLKHFSLPQ